MQKYNRVALETHKDRNLSFNDQTECSKEFYLPPPIVMFMKLPLPIFLCHSKRTLRKHTDVTDTLFVSKQKFNFNPTYYKTSHECQSRFCMMGLLIFLFQKRMHCYYQEGEKEFSNPNVIVRIRLQIRRILHYIIYPTSMFRT